ncbi:MAG: hypothetical protein WCG21_04755 [Eubacteriales bacterium]
MTYYRYNALDIAAYIKWTSIPADTERTYLDLLFQMREHILARPLAKDFESFAMAVFREMYHVWARGFENEFSDVNLIAPEGSVALFCDQEFLALESYMKLLSLHLILTENLPYVRINFAGLPLLIGIEGEYTDFEKNLAEAAKMLRLATKDDRGNVFNLSQGIPNEPLCLGLQSEFREELFGAGGYRVKRNNDYQEKMRVLREKSRREQEVREILKSGVDSRKERKTYLPGIPVFFAPPVVGEEPDPTAPHLFGEPSIPALPLDNIEEDISSPQKSDTSGKE